MIKEILIVLIFLRIHFASAATDCYPFAHPSTEEFVAAGLVTSNILECQTECSRAGFSNAIIADKVCFCSNSLTATAVTNTECNVDCDDGEDCGGQERASQYQAEAILSGLSLSTSKSLVSTYSTADVNYSTASHKSPLTTEFKISSSFGSFKMSPNVGPVNWFLNPSGVTIASVKATDSNSGTEIESLLLDVETEPSNVSLLEPAGKEWNKNSKIEFAVRYGTHLTGTIDFGDQSDATSFNNLLDAFDSVFSYTLSSDSDSSSDLLINSASYDITFNATLTAISLVIVSTDGSPMQLMIFRPNCSVGEVYCHPKRSCILYNEKCEVDTTTKSSYIECDVSSNVFALPLSDCVDSNNNDAKQLKPTITNLPAQLKYHYVEEVELTVTDPGYQLINLPKDKFLRLEPGDIIGITATTTVYKISNSYKSVRGARNTFGDYANRKSNPSGYLIDGTTQSTTDTHPVMELFMVRTSINQAIHNYTVHNCSSSPPTCSNPNSVLSKLNVTNTRLNVNSEDEKFYSVQCPISGVTIRESTALLELSSPLSIEPHPGTEPTYTWDIGDGSSILITKELNRYHVFATVGEFNVTVKIHNLISEVFYWKVITVYEPVTGLRVQRLNNFLVFRPTQAEVIRITLSGGSNISALAELSSGFSENWSLTTTQNSATVTPIDKFFTKMEDYTFTDESHKQIQSGSQTEEMCLEICIQRSGCHGVEFDPPNSCYLIDIYPVFNIQSVLHVPSSGKNLYEMMGSPNDLICRTDWLHSNFNKFRVNASSAVSLISLSVLDPAGGWEPSSTSTSDEYLQIFADELMDLYELKISGKPGSGRPSSTFIVSYTVNGRDWQNLKTVTTNSDPTQITSEEIPGNSVRFRGLRFNSSAANSELRVELTACSAVQYEITAKSITPPEEPFLQELTVNASNVYSWDVYKLSVRVEHVITGFSYKTESYSERNAIVNVSLSTGNNVNISGTFDSNYQIFYNMTTNLDGSIHIPESAISSFGSFPVDLTADNYASNPQNLKFNIDIDWSLINCTVEHEKIYVNRSALAKILFFVDRGSRFNLTVDYGDSNIIHKFVYVWNTTSGSIDISHEFNEVGVYTVTVTAINLISSCYLSQLVTVQNPILSVSNVVPKGKFVSRPKDSDGAAIFETIYDGGTPGLPTNVTLIIDYGDSSSLTSQVVWVGSGPHIFTHPVHNYKANGDFEVVINATNLVSSKIFTYSVRVEDIISDLAIAFGSYFAPVRIPLSYSVTRTWGSHVLMKIDFKDGKTTFLDESQTVSYDHSDSYTYLSKFSIYPQVTAWNNVSNVTAVVPEELVLSYGVRLFKAVGFDKVMLKRPTKQLDTGTSTVAFALCLNSSIYDNEMPTSLSYTIDFGDNSAKQTEPGTCEAVSSSRNEKSFCDNIPGYKLCRLTVDHVYSNHGNFSVEINITNPVSSQLVTWQQEIYSEIYNIDNSVNLHPIYKTNDPAWGKSPIYPIEQPLYLNVSLDFGDELGIKCIWDLGNNQILTTNSLFLAYQYTILGTYTIKVRVENPVDFEVLTTTVTMYRSVGDISLSSIVPYSMKTRYFIDMNIGSMGTKACYELDYSLWGDLVMNSTSRVVFGDTDTCGSLASEINTDLTTRLDSDYESSLKADGRIDTQLTWETMISYFGNKNITFRGWNAISSSTIYWIMTVARGPCYYPKSNLKIKSGQEQRKRLELIIFDSGISVSCYNVTTHIQWKLEKKMSTGVWADFTTELQTFLNTFPQHAKKYLNTTQLALSGYWDPQQNFNQHLTKLIVPPFAFKAGNTYRATFEARMLLEPTLIVTEIMTIEIIIGNLIPCTGLPEVYTFKWPLILNFNSTCSYDEDVFYDGGETDSIEIDGWYCNRYCDNVKFGKNFQFDPNDQTHDCFQHIGCFRQNSTRKSPHRMLKIMKNEWTDYSTSPSPNKELIKEAYTVFKWDELSDDKVNVNVTKELYSFNTKMTEIEINTNALFEFEIYTFSFVLKSDGRYVKMQQFVDVKPGDPPIMKISCTTNCVGKQVSNKKVKQIDRSRAYRYQGKVENFIWGEIYEFLWCISQPIFKSIEEFSFDMLSYYMDSAQCKGNWQLKTSTGVNQSGISFDKFPIFPQPDSKTVKPIQIIRVTSWRKSAPNITGFGLDYFQINIPPDVTKLKIIVSPKNGFGLETLFKISCSGATDEDKLLNFKIGYLTNVDQEKKESNCKWLIGGIPACYSETMLPPGIKKLNYKIIVCIKVLDKYGMGVMRYSEEVEVKQLNVPIKDMMKVDGKGTKLLEDLASSNSPVTLASSGGLFFTHLNEKSEETDDNEYTPAEIRKIKENELNEKIELREVLFKIIEKGITQETVSKLLIQDLQVLSRAINEGTSKSDEMNINSQSIAIKISDIVTDKLIELSQKETVSFDDVKAVANNAVSSIGDVIMTQKKALKVENVTQPDRTSGELAVHNKELFRNIQKSLDKVIEAVDNKMVIGQDPVILVSESLQILTEKRNPMEMFTRSPLRSGLENDCTSMKLHSGENLFKVEDPNNPGKFYLAPEVQTSMIVFRDNVVNWSNKSANISSKSLGIKYRDVNNKEFEVSSTKSNDTNIEIWLDSNDQNEKYSYIETTIPSKKMITHEVFVRPDNVLFINLERFWNYTDYLYNTTVNDTLVEMTRTELSNNHTYAGEFYFQVFVREDKRPTEDVYDHYCELPHEITPCEKWSKSRENTPLVTTTQSPEVTTTLSTGVTTTQYTTTITPNENAMCNCDNDGKCTRQNSNFTDSSLVNCLCSVGSNECTIEPSPTKDDVCSSVNGAAASSSTRSKWTCYFDSQTLQTNDTGRRFVIGVRALKRNSSVIEDVSVTNENNNEQNSKSNSKKKDSSDYVVVTYRSMIRSTGCYFLNLTTLELETNGCFAGPCSTLKSTQCVCDHLTDFMSSVFVPPIQINPADSAFLKLDSNPIAFALCLSLICFWFLVVIWAARRDKDDLIKTGVIPLPCNDPRDKWPYEITVWTGRRNRSGTTSNVTFILTGEEAETYPRVLRDADPEREVLQRTGVDTFLMTTPLHLGHLTHLRIYHDNSGPSPEWYFSRMLVEDLINNKKYYFIVNKWLSIEDEDGLIDRVVPVAGVEEINGFENVFWTRTSKNFFDGHLWFSVVTRPPRSKFTRVQRATCCLVLLMYTLMVNLMFYGQADKVESPKLFEIGPVRVSPHSIFMATVSALIVVPINVFIVVLFRNRRDRVKKTKIQPDEEPRTASQLNLATRKKSSAISMVDLQKESSSTSHRPITPREVNFQGVHPSQPAYGQEDYSSHPDQVTQSTVALDTTGNYKKPKSLGEKVKVLMNKIFPLPWWTYIIGYILSLISVGVCFYLIVEFGGVLGEQKTGEWLASIVISLLQSIVLVQPIKIFALVLLYAIVIKSPEEDEDEVAKELMLVGASRVHKETTLDDLKDPYQAEKLRQLKRSAPPPVDEEYLEEIRKKRQKEKEMQAILQDLAFYVVFLLVLMSMAYTSQDYRTFLQNDAVSRMFLEGHHHDGTKGSVVGFNDIKNWEDVWSYVNHTMLPTFFPTSCYNGDSSSSCYLKDGSWTNDGMLYRLRNAQIRQVRIKPPGNCKIVKDFRTYITRCRETYSLGDEDTETYAPKWLPFNSSVHTKLKEWSFTSALDLYGYPTWGSIATYGGGGYLAEFKTDLATARVKLQELVDNFWLDPFSRGLFLEFLIYNVNTNMYTSSAMLLEFTNGGGAKPYPKFFTLRLNRYYGINFIVYATIDGLSAVLVFFFVIREIKQIKRMGKRYFKDFWNFMDFTLIILTFLEFVFFLLRMTIQQLMSYFLKTYPDKFFNFQWVGFWDETNQALMGFIVFVFTIRFLRMLSFNRKLAMLGQVLKESSAPLGSFMICFMIIFFAFAQCGYLMFYKVVASFQTFVSTVETLGVMSLNKFDFTTFAVGGGDLGLTFFFIYMVFISFILINFFVTIITIAFSQVKEDWVNTKNKYELLDYITTKMKKFFGLGNNNSNSAVDTRFAYVSDEIDFDEQMNDFDNKLDTLIDKLNIMVSNEKSNKIELEEPPKKPQETLAKRIFLKS